MGVSPGDILFVYEGGEHYDVRSLGGKTEKHHYEDISLDLGNFLNFNFLEEV